MIIRKPTKIDLKPEDDLHEYEEYKRKQQESKNKNDIKPKGNNEKLLSESKVNNPIKMNL
jgi:hypothetical protein